jgi:hypothetical protein
MANDVAVALALAQGPQTVEDGRFYGDEALDVPMINQPQSASSGSVEQMAA